MLTEVSNFRLCDPEDISFAKHYLTNNSRDLINLLTSFSREDLIILIKAEILWYKRKDLLKRLTARYSKLERQQEWMLIKKVIHGKAGFNEIDDYGQREEDRDLLKVTG